jgi:arsenate reductase
MKKLLFVCYGNVGRSQMAEAFYNHFSNSNDSWSAGIQKDTPKRYGKPAEHIINVMKESGIDISHAKVKTLAREMVIKSKKTVVLCRKEQCPEYLLKSNNVIFWNIEDPFEMTLDNTRKIRDIIKTKVYSLTKK